MRNIRVNTVLNMGVLVLNFFSRKIFLDCLGADVIGLNSTLYNILEFLNFAELGIMSGVRFMLYKPFHDNETSAINDIITLQGLIYRVISLAIIFLAVVVMFFLPVIFGKMTLPLWYAYASFGVLLYSYLIGNFVNYRQVMFDVSQHSYILTRYSVSLSVAKTCFQMLAIYYSANGYIWWLVSEVVFSSVACLMIYGITQRHYPFLDRSELSFRELLRKYGVLVVKVRQLFFHRMGSIVLTKTTPVIIYAFTTLSEVALYGNYKMLVRGMETLVNISFWSIGPGIGNLVAENDREKTVAIFHEIYVVRMLMTCVSVYCLMTFSSPFISLWLGGVYLLDSATVSIIAASLALAMVRMPFDMFTQASGMFQDIWAPVFEAVMNIGCALAGGYLYGLNGILCGGMVGSVVIVLIWKPWFLFRRGFGRGCSTVYIQLGNMCAGAAVSVLIVSILLKGFPISGCESWTCFVCGAILQSGLFSATLLVYAYLTDRFFRKFISRFR